MVASSIIINVSVRYIFCLINKQIIFNRYFEVYIWVSVSLYRLIDYTDNIICIEEDAV